jgi:predicted nucleic acid-binding protein
MKKIIVFDTGPIISLTLNNLLWILEPLNKKFNGKFYIPIAVKKELIDKPLTTKKFKFEALQITPLITNGTLEVIENDFIISKTKYLVDLANRCCKAKGNFIQIIQEGEMETVATALFFESNIIVVDERITRMLIEDPKGIKHLLERRLHTEIKVNKENLKTFYDVVKNLNVIRSIELVTIAYELGILDKYMDKRQGLMVNNVEKVLLEGVLWAVKLNGCSVSEEEINDILKIELDKD